jgi:uncharacterized RDD family membrane protein YckC
MSKRDRTTGELASPVGSVNMVMPSAQAVPSTLRRVAALPYEGLLMLALMLVMSFPIAGLKGATLSGVPHLMFQFYLFAILLTYFTWFWRHGGQTLPMKTWKLRVVTRDGAPLDWKFALRRFACAALFYGPACAGIMLIFFPNRISPVITMWMFLPMLATLFWAKFDADRQFLHDRWAGTRIIDATLPK